MIRTLTAVSAIALLLAMPARAEDSAPAEAKAAAPIEITAPAETAKPEAAAEKPAEPVKPAADMVVAKVNGKDITFGQLEAFYNGLDEQTKQVPMAMLYPRLRDVLVDATLLVQKAESLGLDKSPEAVSRLAHAKLEITLISKPDQIEERLRKAREKVLRDLYIQQEVDKRITAKMLHDVFDNALKENPPSPERHVRHILVENEDAAKALIEKLKGGADFDKLAQENMKAEFGASDIGWINEKSPLVKPFLEAAFKVEPGKFTETPVKSQFGFHIIKVDEARTPEIKFEDQAQSVLEYVQKQLAQDVAKELHDSAKIETFEYDGKPTPAEKPAESEKPADGEKPAAAAKP